MAARAKGNRVWAADTVLTLADALDVLGKAGQIGTLVEELGSNTGDVDAPIAQAALRSCQAIVARKEGHDLKADALLESARQILGDSGLRYDEAQASERLGRWRCERGAPDGPAMLEDALHIYGELHASRDVARVSGRCASAASPSLTRGAEGADRMASGSHLESGRSRDSPPLGCRSRSELAAHLTLTDPDE